MRRATWWMLRATGWMRRATWWTCRAIALHRLPLAPVYSHNGPIRCRKCGYILMTDQLDAGNPTAGLDTVTVELTVEPLTSQFTTAEFDSHPKLSGTFRCERVGWIRG
eukprot:567213-Prorocentrum_minimum.AAC.1